MFLAYFLSFAIISSYWFTHNFLFSLLAKNVDRIVVNLNFVFLAFLSLIPFSSHFLGTYPQSKTSVFVYSTNIAIVAFIVWITRNYIYGSSTIANPKFSEINLNDKDILYGSIRTWISFVGALLAMILSFVSTYVSIILLVAQVVILVIPGGVQYFAKITKLDKLKLHPKWDKLKD